MHNFKELNLRKDSVGMASDVFEITKSFPVGGRFGIVYQIHRSAVSIPSDVAEGSAGKSKKDFSGFPEISRGSRAETEKRLITAAGFGYITETGLTVICSEPGTIQKMIPSIKEKLS